MGDLALAKCAGVSPTEHPAADSLVRTFFDQVNWPAAVTEVKSQLRMVRTQLEQRQRDQQPVDVDVHDEPPSAQRLMMTGLQFFEFFDFYASPVMNQMPQLRLHRCVDANGGVDRWRGPFGHLLARRPWRKVVVLVRKVH